MGSQISDIAREVDYAFLWVGGTSLLLLFGITVAMVYLVIRYRRGANPTTSQIEGNKTLEIVWIILPTILVFWMFYIGYKGFVQMRDVPDDAMVVKVTGRQWAWSFYYPEDGVTASEMVVPVGKPVKALLSSPKDDVIHSFFIPDFRVKEDVLPGKETYLWFEGKRIGNYNIFCAEFCGKDHSRMLSMLRIVSEEDYRAWIKSQIARRYKPLEFSGFTNPNHPAFGADDLNIDPSLLFGVYCASCHGQQGDGSGLPGEARDFRTLKGWSRSAKVTDIYRTLLLGVKDSRMRPYPNLTPWERVALGHYVRAFIKDPAPEITEGDYAELVKEFELDKITGPKESIPIEDAMAILVREAGVTPPPITE